eukprot:194449_1
MTQITKWRVVLLQEVKNLTKQKTDALIEERDRLNNICSYSTQQQTHIDFEHMQGYFAGDGTLTKVPTFQNISVTKNESSPITVYPKINDNFSPKYDCLLTNDCHVAVNLSGLLNILEIVRNRCAVSEEQQNIKTIKHGPQAETLLFAGYIRSITKTARMPGNKDVEQLCFRYYYWNVTTSNIDLNPAKFLCYQIRNVLHGKVEEVFVDELNHRDNDVPFRILDHSTKPSLRRKSAKVSIAINPENVIMKALYDRNCTDLQYEQSCEYLVNLLYGTQLACCDLPLSNPRNWCQEIHKMIKLGLDIDNTDSDNSTDYDDSTDSDASEVTVDSSSSDKLFQVFQEMTRNTKH